MKKVAIRNNVIVNPYCSKERKTNTIIIGFIVKVTIKSLNVFSLCVAFSRFFCHFSFIFIESIIKEIGRFRCNDWVIQESNLRESMYYLFAMIEKRS